MFGVFSSGFLHRTTLLFLYNHFWHVFGKKNSNPNCPICMGYRLCKMVDFRNGLIFWIFGVVFSVFLHKITLFFLQNHFSHVFAKKRHPNCPFAWSTKLGDNFRDRSVVSKFLHGRDDIARCEVVDHNQKEPWDNPGSLWNWFEIRKAIIFQLYTVI